MAKKDRKYKVEMVMTGNPPKPKPELKNSNGQPVALPIVFNKDNDNMKKVDHYRIRFELDNPNQTNLRFIQNKADVMWCHGATTCPISFCDMPGVFWVDAIDANGEWVDVINMDLTVQHFAFTLNFADKNISNPTQADYVPLDPVGDNQDAGSAGSDFTISALAAVSLGVLAGMVAFTAAEAFLPAW